MKKLLLAGALALGTITACTTIPTSPGAVAEHTIADEEAMRKAELAYKLSRTIGELGVDAGLIKGNLAVQAAALDNKLYASLLIARGAYRTFNSDDLLAASREVESLALQVEALVKGAGQ